MSNLFVCTYTFILSWESLYIAHLNVDLR